MDSPCSFFILRQGLGSSAGLELKTPGLFLLIPETTDRHHHSRLGLPFVTASYSLLTQLSPPLIQSPVPTTEQQYSVQLTPNMLSL